MLAAQPARRDTRNHETRSFTRDWTRGASRARLPFAGACRGARGRDQTQGRHEDHRDNRRLRGQFLQGENQLRVRRGAERPSRQHRGHGQREEVRTSRAENCRACGIRLSSTGNSANCKAGQDRAPSRCRGFAKVFRSGHRCDQRRRRVSAHGCAAGLREYRGAARYGQECSAA